MTAMAAWKYKFEGREFGPFSVERMRELAHLGVIRPDTQVRRDGMLGWAPFRVVAHEVLDSADAPPARTPEEDPVDIPDHRTEDSPQGPPENTEPEDGFEAFSAPEVRLDDIEVPQRSGRPDTNVRSHVPVADRTGSDSRNYFLRHWAGDLSLAVSFWINGVLLAAAAVAAGLYVASLETGRRLEGDALAFLLPLVGVVMLWQLVGIWRAAGRRAADNGVGPLVTAVAVRTCVVVAAVSGVALVGLTLR